MSSIPSSAPGWKARGRGNGGTPAQASNRASCGSNDLPLSLNEALPAINSNLETPGLLSERLPDLNLRALEPAIPDSEHKSTQAQKGQETGF